MENWEWDWQGKRRKGSNFPEPVLDLEREELLPVEQSWEGSGLPPGTDSGRIPTLPRFRCFQGSCCPWVLLFLGSLTVTGL